MKPKFPADLVTFTEEILNGKLHFLCSEVNPGQENRANTFGTFTNRFRFFVSALSLNPENLKKAQLTFTCSKSTTERLEIGVKSFQS